MSKQRVVLVGYPLDYHIGAHFLKAAQRMGIEMQLCDPTVAFATNKIIRQINWRLRGHRPPRLSAFSQRVLEICQAEQPDLLLVTGITPPDAETLKRIRAMHIRCANYLTDDPWNAAHYAPWFFKALPYYDVIFSPRTANRQQLSLLGCRVEHLPFAYSPDLHYYEPAPPIHASKFRCEMLFYGGADQDRVPYIRALLDQGIDLHLYGGSWERHRFPPKVIRGHSTPQWLRWAVAGAEVTLCLVRRANRDGHVMRSYEAPAMGACMLVEDTFDHRNLFGEEGETVLYFSNIPELLEKTQYLLLDDTLRSALASNVYQKITSEKNTYADRLSTILEHCQIGYTSHTGQI